MIKKNGILYYTMDNILERLYKDEASRELENHNWFKISDLDYEFKWEFSSEGKYIPILNADIEIIATPQEVIHEIFYLRKLREIISDPVIIKDKEKQEYLEGIIESLEDNIDQKKYDYLHGTHIKEKPCYIWIDINGEFSGVYNGFPQSLLDGPLNPKMNYKCSVCKEVTSTFQEIPEMFYDPSTEDHICPRCANNYSKRVKHVGS